MFLPVTYDHKATNVSALMAAAAVMGIHDSNIILTDFDVHYVNETGPKDLAKIQEDMARVRPKVFWILQHDPIPDSFYRSFIADADAAYAPKTDDESANEEVLLSIEEQDESSVTLGPKELVFVGGTSTGSCDPFDLPDAPARAWRDGDGTVHLAASWATSRFGHGPELGSAEHSCAVVFNSTMSGQNSLYAVSTQANPTPTFQGCP